MTGHPPTERRPPTGPRADDRRADDRQADDRQPDDHHARDLRADDRHARDLRTGDLRAGEQGWAALHGGLTPSTPVRLWLGAVQRVARAGPVAAVPPDVLSAAGVLVGAAALAVAAAGGHWPLLTAALVVLVGVLDGLDGAVALHTGRARPLGAVVDAMADRLGDLLLAATLVVLGAPPPWCVAAATLALLHEYLRARAGAAGMTGPGAVTVAERPTRLVLVAVAAVGTGVLPAGTPWTGWGWATVSATGWVVVGAVGLVHLGIGVVRATPRQFPR